MGVVAKGEIWGGRWCVVLAVLALSLGMLVPQGFMLAGSRGEPRLVICTGHGPLAIATPDDGKDGHTPAKAPKPETGGACPFAHHAAAIAPPAQSGGEAGFAEWRLAPQAVSIDLAPGRGLAAPPPPSHGPPVDLIQA